MSEPRNKITLPYLFKKVADCEPITWLTCYDYPTAYLQEQAGIEMILVGDSLGMTMLGYESTLPVTPPVLLRKMDYLLLLRRICLRKPLTKPAKSRYSKCIPAFFAA